MNHLSYSIGVGRKQHKENYIMNYVSNSLTVKELKATAKQYGITGYSALNKADLINYINNHVRAAAQDIVEAIEAADEIEASLIEVEVPTLVEELVEPKAYTEPELTLAVLLIIIDQALDFVYDNVVVPLAKVAYQILLATYTLWRKARPRRLVNNP